MTFTVHEYKDVRWNNTIAILGFPSVGLASSIAANFLARTLELEIIGGISSSEFPPYAVIQGGVPLPPVRVYAGDRNCDVDSGMNCDGLIVVTSEFMPKIEQHHQLAVTFMDWFQKNNVKTVICLEGIPQFDPEESRILGVGSTPAANEIMQRYSIEGLEDSLVRGTSGVMLYEGAMRGMDVLAILAPARVDLPDPRGAAKLMEPLARMLPELKIDPEPLYKEAEEAERRMGIQQTGTLGNVKNKDFLYG
ncbi:MAG: PAC2 family protein [Methanomassiliicoccaceae archaeon]|nr:PAC2 family protein [Methanomassiliicoccaceae archaeon]